MLTDSQDGSKQKTEIFAGMPTYLLCFPTPILCPIVLVSYWFIVIHHKISSLKQHSFIIIHLYIQSSAQYGWVLLYIIISLKSRCWLLKVFIGRLENPISRSFLFLVIGLSFCLLAGFQVGLLSTPQSHQNHCQTSSPSLCQQWYAKSFSFIQLLILFLLLDGDNPQSWKGSCD